MYIEYYASDGSVRGLGDNELQHYNHKHDALGRFARGSGGDPGASIATKIDKIDVKTGKLQNKSAKYKVKAAKQNLKASKIAAKGGGLITSRTSIGEGYAMKAARYSARGAKFTKKAAVIDKKIAKLNKQRIKLGHEQVKLLEQQYPDVFEPGWRDKYKDLGSDIYDVTAYKKGNEYTVVSNSRKKK